VSAERFTTAIPFAEIAETANDVIIVTTADVGPPGPTIVFVNPAFTRLTGYAAKDIIGLSPRILQGPGTSRTTLDQIHAGLLQGQMVRATVLNYARTGVPYWLDMSISPIRDETGSVVYFAAIERDVSADKHRLVDLDYAFERDPETGVPMRRTLLRALAGEIDAATATPPTVAPPCAAVITVEGFPQLATSIGGDAAKALLFGVADRLRENVRRIDLLARVGDSAFAVCMPNVRPCDAKALAAGLQNAVRAAPVPTPAGPISVSVSFGVAAFAKADTAESLLERAATGDSIVNV
jgi:PAS domain S-box-containing protein/diguanylate cyclase (GGDEF)-like protein